jgi:actin-like ATPase involved in cell morphogenesis
VRIGGDRFDEAIINYVRRNYGTLIGEATAERIKHEIGSAYPGNEVREIEVKGRNLAEGVPRSFTLNSNEILEACRSRCRASSARSRWPWSRPRRSSAPTSPSAASC